MGHTHKPEIVENFVNNNKLFMEIPETGYNINHILCLKMDQ